MSNYAAGAALERKFCEWAEERYGCVAVRAAGSHGKADVVLIPILDTRQTSFVLIAPVVVQVKRSKQKGKEFEEFKAWRPIGFNRWWVSKPKGVKFEDMKIEVL